MSQLYWVDRRQGHGAGSRRRARPRAPGTPRHAWRPFRRRFSLRACHSSPSSAAVWLLFCLRRGPRSSIMPTCLVGIVRSRGTKAERMRISSRCEYDYGPWPTRRSRQRPVGAASEIVAGEGPRSSSASWAVCGGRPAKATRGWAAGISLSPLPRRRGDVVTVLEAAVAGGCPSDDAGCERAVVRLVIVWRRSTMPSAAPSTASRRRPTDEGNRLTGGVPTMHRRGRRFIMTTVYFDHAATTPVDERVSRPCCRSSSSTTATRPSCIVWGRWARCRRGGSRPGGRRVGAGERDRLLRRHRVG